MIPDLFAVFSAVVLIELVSCQTQTSNTCGSLLIRPSSIADSWQTSNYDNNCFKAASEDKAPKPNTFNFFHSSDVATTADNQFQWFVVQLKQQTTIVSVTITNRGTNVDRNSRAAEIEIWTSESEHINFGDEHCNNKGIHSQFVNTRVKWQRCGSTPAAESISPAQNLTVQCQNLHQVRYLLLRRNVKNRHSPYMNFVDMALEKSLVKIEATPPGTDPLIQGSNFSVKCSKLCPAVTGAADIQLCTPNGRCHDTRLDFDRLEPSSAGNYTCRSGSQILSQHQLSILHPPKTALLSPLPGGSTSADVCGAASTNAGDATFSFESSAANPLPEHLCIAADGAGIRAMRRVPHNETAGADGVRSLWLCENCSSARQLTVTCNASQNASFPSVLKVWKCEPPDELEIKFEKIVDRGNSFEVDFEFFSSASTPVALHNCTAIVPGSTASLNHWIDKDKRDSRGVLKSYWTANIILPGKQWQLYVQCDARSKQLGWLRHKTESWTQPLVIATWRIAVTVGALLALIVVTLVLVILCSLRRLRLKPIDLVRVGAVQAAQCIWPAAADGGAQTHTLHVVYDNYEADNIYDVLRKISESKENNEYIL